MKVRFEVAMPDPRYSQFCDHLAECWMLENFDAIADFYSHPLAVYYGNTVRIELTRQDTIDAIAMRITRSRAAGAKTFEAELGDVSRSEDGRVVLHIIWKYLDATDTLISQSVLRYYCREDDAGAIKIHMVEFESVAYPVSPESHTKRRDH